jgi:hypothetical protein
MTCNHQGQPVRQNKRNGMVVRVSTKQGMAAAAVHAATALGMAGASWAA